MNKRTLTEKLRYEGCVFNTNNCGKVIIKEYINAMDVLVEFIDTGYSTKVQMSALRRGEVKDYTNYKVCGVGVIGDSCNNYNKEETFKVWKRMLYRCYADYVIAKSPTYLDCEVSNSFKHYDYFKNWCNEQVGFGSKGWHLDKDILVKGNRVYSEDTCCFVPREINSLVLTCRGKRGEYPIGVSYNKSVGKFQARFNVDGVKQHVGYFQVIEEAFQAYKQAKEAYIKEVAELYKDQIDPRVYEALMKYEVDIND